MGGMADTAATQARVTMAIMDMGITGIPAATPWVAVVNSRRGKLLLMKLGVQARCFARL